MAKWKQRSACLWGISQTAIWRLYFHPAKFDNFKDDKMSDYTIVSVAQSKNLLDWKPASLTNHELLLWAGFFMLFGAFFFLKYCSICTKMLHYIKLKENTLKTGIVTRKWSFFTSLFPFCFFHEPISFLSNFAKSHMIKINKTICCLIHFFSCFKWCREIEV